MDLSQQVSYTPYGVRSGSLESNLGYAGEWTDKTTNNSYLRARWYDADTGVFLSVDPLTQKLVNLMVTTPMGTHCSK